MNVSRRTFMKTIGAGIFTLATGVGIDDLFRQTPTPNPIIGADWELDFGNKVIKYVGKGDTTWRVQELYSALMERFDDYDYIDHDVPMTGITPVSYQLNNDWRILDEDIQYLTGGAIQDSFGNIWHNFYSIGQIDTGATKREQGTNLWASFGEEEILNARNVKNHIDMLIKTKEKGVVKGNGEFVIRARAQSMKPYEYRIAYGMDTVGRMAIPIVIVSDDIYGNIAPTKINYYPDVRKITTNQAIKKIQKRRIDI